MNFNQKRSVPTAAEVVRFEHEFCSLCFLNDWLTLLFI